jgi:hypothetical protein
MGSMGEDCEAEKDEIQMSEAMSGVRHASANLLPIESMTATIIPWCTCNALHIVCLMIEMMELIISTDLLY